MKRLLLILTVALSLNVSSQTISVSTTAYSVPDLVNNILINSPCITANNITWRTGTNYGSTNGIGFFQNTNPNFPLQSGVILSTGNVMEASGPNTSIISSGSSSWEGDAELEATLASSGITMNSTNATVLEFEFVPLSPHFDFDFLFASEEYGNFQCQFSDAFAFLLTNLNTGETTNLAIVPGSNDPISVVTIRDFLYNSNCPSVNQSFFGSYNGGSNASLAATNFNGQTKVMNASAMLTPNIPYKIKLVIADRGDYKSDSAIFLSSNSFNIGQDVLGSNLTTGNNSALCTGQTKVLDTGLSSTLYSFTWKKNGVLISGQNGPSLTVSSPGTYEVTYYNNAYPCQTVSDEVTIEYLAPFNSGNPKNLYKCNSNQASYTYDLSLCSTSINIGINPALAISYHASQSDADNDINPLPLSFASSGNQTIYTRINSPNNSCYVVKSFQLLLTAPPTSTHPSDYHQCAIAANSNQGTFSLNTLNGQTLNGQSINIYGVSYFATLADANANINQLPNNFTTTSTTIYARVKVSGDSNCYSVTTANLIVESIPPVDELEDVITCVSYELHPLTNGNYFTGPNGTGTPLFAGDIIDQTQIIYIYNSNNGILSCPNNSNFKVTIIKPDELAIKSGTYCGSYTLPGLTDGEYHTEPNGGGTILTSGTEITTTQTVYFYFTSTLPNNCIIDAPFVITITSNQPVPNMENVFDCTSYTLPTLSLGNYYDGPNGTGNLLQAGTTITNTKTIYIYNKIGTCESESFFTVNIGLNFPTSITECAQYILPTLPIGNYYTEPLGNGTQILAGTIINTTQTIYVYAISQSLPNCTDNYNFTVTITLPTISVPSVTTGCENYTLPSISVGNYFTGPNGTGTPMFAGDVITSSQTIHIYLNNNISCQNDVPVNITVNTRPEIDSRSEIDACNIYTLTSLSNGNYYTGPNGTGTKLQGGDILTSSQLIYIYANENNCVSETSFQVNISIINAFKPDDISVCDSYILPTLLGNNKYYTQSNGQYGTGTELLAGSIINSTQLIYVFNESHGRINCWDEKSFTVTIIPTPVIVQTPVINACNSYTLPVLSVGNYYTNHNGIGTMLNAGDVITTSQTIYVYAETGTAVNCFDEKSIAISIYNVDEIQDITTCDSYTLPSLINGNYYNNSNGTGGMIAAGTKITSSKTIYIFGNSGFNPNCSDESSFDVTIIPIPIANSVPQNLRTICDEDGTNDGVTTFNLNQLNSTILGSQIGIEFSINYFSSVDDANNNVNPITSTNLQTIFVRVSNSLTPNCFDVKPITIIVNKLPIPTPKDGIICIDNVTGNTINPCIIYSGLSSSTHSFQWFNSSNSLIGTQSNLLVSQSGTYSVIATNNSTGCSSETIFVTVKESEIAKIDYTINEDFSSNQVLTIQASGLGDYEYQIDNETFQDSPIFENILSGIHIVTVRDKNGCGISVKETVIINYPKYFTPNGDGYNETWNINDLKNQKEALIFIYDRYGKLLKKITPSGNGWDGKLNNYELPSDDYWFTLNYKKGEEIKEFKSHFTLKR